MTLEQVEEGRANGQRGKRQGRRKTWEVQRKVSRETVSADDGEDVVVYFEGLLVDTRG